MVLENSLLNLLNFLFLRADSVRVRNKSICGQCWKQLKNGTITHTFLDLEGAVHVSAKVKSYTANGERRKSQFESSGLSKRWNELMNALNSKINYCI